MSAAQKQQLDILVNNAGVQLSAAATALDKAQEANGGKQPAHGLIVAAANEFAKCNACNVAIQEFSNSLVPVEPPAPPPNNDGHGDYPIGSYSKADATFLYWYCTTVYTPQTGRQDIWRDGFYGTSDAINLMIAAGYPGLYVPPDSGNAYTGPYRAMAAATLAKYKP